MNCHHESTRILRDERRNADIEVCNHCAQEVSRIPDTEKRQTIIEEWEKVGPLSGNFEILFAEWANRDNGLVQVKLKYLDAVAEPISIVLRCASIPRVGQKIYLYSTTKELLHGLRE